MAEKSTDDRIREKAYELWEADGHPHGRDEFHWSQARQIISIEDDNASTLISLSASLRDPAEPAVAFQNQAELPDLTGQGESEPGPSWEAAAAAAEPRPLAVEAPPEPPIAKPAVKRAAAKITDGAPSLGKAAAKPLVKKKT